MDGASRLLHATCIAVGDRAALLLGPSGAGKSDLALRAISTLLYDGTQSVGARLVCDDQVLVDVEGGRLRARPPGAIAGRIEVRGIGIVSVAHQPVSYICLAVEIGADGAIERMPEPEAVWEILGVRVPRLRLRPFEASAPLKLVLALARSESIEAVTSP